MAVLDPAVVSEQTTRPNGKTRPSMSQWPVSVSSLRALSDLGLSDVKIAACFGVRTEQVMSLRNPYGIAGAEWSA